MCLEGTARIPLRARDGSVRAYALVDVADAEWANQWRWCLSGTGHGAYAVRRDYSGERPRMVYLHRAVLGLVPGDGLEGDHRNRDKLDNRRANLRVVPQDGQAHNLPGWRNATSTFRGVWWDKRQKQWQAGIVVKGKHHHLGYFDDEIEAAEAAKAARERLMPFSTD